MVLALGMHHSQEALKAQTAVTDMTNELLKQNAQALKIGTIQTAKEAERGIIDIETLIQTNQDLIDTINDVMEIQSQGHAKRIEAEKTLYSMEAELKKSFFPPESDDSNPFGTACNSIAVPVFKSRKGILFECA